MKLNTAPSTLFSAAELDQDFRDARDVGKVRLGRLCLYFTKFSGTGCVPYDTVSRAWLRQEEVNASLCCGRANFDQFFLMVQDAGGTLYKGQVLSKLLGKQALGVISQTNATVAIGVAPKN